jgi:polar amino acid transport system substrate-binding protein
MKAVQLAIPANLPPPLLYEKGGELTGIVSEYSMLLVEFLGRKGIVTVLPRNRLASYLIKGTVDFLCYTNKDWTDERDSLLWANPLFIKREVILGPSPMPKQLIELKGKIIGTMLGYLYPKLDEHFRNKVIYREDGPNEESNLNKLLNAHIEYIITDEIYLDHYKKKHPNIDMGRERLPLQQYPITCSLSKNGSVTVQELNKAIGKLKASKKLEGIFSKYGVSFHPI